VVRIRIGNAAVEDDLSDGSVGNKAEGE